MKSATFKRSSDRAAAWSHMTPQHAFVMWLTDSSPFSPGITHPNCKCDFTAMKSWRGQQVFSCFSQKISVVFWFGASSRVCDLYCLFTQRSHCSGGVLHRETLIKNVDVVLFIYFQGCRLRRWWITVVALRYFLRFYWRTVEITVASLLASSAEFKS